MGGDDGLPGDRPALNAGPSHNTSLIAPPKEQVLAR